MRLYATICEVCNYNAAKDCQQQAQRAGEFTMRGKSAASGCSIQIKKMIEKKKEDDDIKKNDQTNEKN
jgi:hypothetical protein